LELLATRGASAGVCCASVSSGEIDRSASSRRGSVRIKLDYYALDGDKACSAPVALTNARCQCSPEFFILYGDSYLPIEYAPVPNHFIAAANLA